MVVFLNEHICGYYSLEAACAKRTINKTKKKTKKKKKKKKDSKKDIC